MQRKICSMQFVLLVKLCEVFLSPLTEKSYMAHTQRSAEHAAAMRSPASIFRWLPMLKMDLLYIHNKYNKRLSGI